MPSRTAASTGAVSAVSITATRHCRQARGFGLGKAMRTPRASMASGTAMSCRAISRSRALRASGPITAMSLSVMKGGSVWPSAEATPRVGL